MLKSLKLSIYLMILVAISLFIFSIILFKDSFIMLELGFVLGIILFFILDSLIPHKHTLENLKVSLNSYIIHHSIEFLIMGIFLGVILKLDCFKYVFLALALILLIQFLVEFIKIRKIYGKNLFYYLILYLFVFLVGYLITLLNIFAFLLSFSAGMLIYLSIDSLFPRKK